MLDLVRSYAFWPKPHRLACGILRTLYVVESVCWLNMLESIPINLFDWHGRRTHLILQTLWLYTINPNLTVWFIDSPRCRIVWFISHYFLLSKTQVIYTYLNKIRIYLSFNIPHPFYWMLYKTVWLFRFLVT